MGGALGDAVTGGVTLGDGSNGSGEPVGGANDGSGDHVGGGADGEID
jgi:hypothetical protein